MNFALSPEYKGAQKSGSVPGTCALNLTALPVNVTCFMMVISHLDTSVTVSNLANN